MSPTDAMRSFQSSLVMTRPRSNAPLVSSQIAPRRTSGVSDGLLRERDCRILSDSAPVVRIRGPLAVPRTARFDADAILAKTNGLLSETRDQLGLRKIVREPKGTRPVENDLQAPRYRYGNAFHIGITNCRNYESLPRDVN